MVYPFPTNSDFLRPCLVFLDKCSPISRDDMKDKLAKNFRLTPADLSLPTRNGSNTMFNSRIDWVRTHLVWAGLMNIHKRGTWEITDKGRSYLASHRNFGIKDLMKIPSFAAHKRRR